MGFIPEPASCFKCTRLGKGPTPTRSGRRGGFVSDRFDSGPRVLSRSNIWFQHTTKGVVSLTFSDLDFNLLPLLRKRRLLKECGF